MDMLRGGWGVGLMGNGAAGAAAPDIAAPTVASRTPADNATGVSIATLELVVTFNETVVLGTGVITLKRTSDNVTIDSWNVVTDAGTTVEVLNGTDLTLYLNNWFPNTSTEYYVIWDAGVVKDAANNNVAAQASTTVWSFTTVSLFTSATLNLDLTSAGTAASLTTTRTGTAAYAENLAGVWTNFGANIARITDKGLLVEEARTNVALHNRDLTNAAWVKVNCTPLKDQTGIDGVASSASKITATAANATCLQTVTLTSSARFQTAFVKRITGSGNVDMTTDNGTTWTTVTVTAGWTRVSIPSQTVTNPVFGFRLVTSGDAIAVDMLQNENGAFATSPILVTTVAVARGADTIVITSFAWFTAGPGTVYAEAIVASGLTTPISFIIYDATANNRIQIGLATSKTQGLIVASAATQVNGSPGAALSPGQTSKGAMAFATNDGDIAGEGIIGTPDTTVTLPVVTSARIGHLSTVNSIWNGYVKRVAYWNTRLTADQLAALTS